MAKPEFKKAVEVSKKIDGLTQPKSFLQESSKNKKWEEYEKKLRNNKLNMNK